MNDETEVTKAEAAGKRTGGLLGVVAGRFIVTAVVGWLGVLALGNLGVNVPFMGAWLGFLVALYVVKVIVSEASAAFHRERVEADVSLIAASLAAQEAIQQQQAAEGLAGLLGSLSKTSDEGNGAYL